MKAIKISFFLLLTSIANFSFAQWSFNGTDIYNNNSSGQVGIGMTSPNAPLQFASSLANRKIVLYETANNDHEYLGFGINAGMLRYQVANSGDDHVFFRGNGSGASVELMRIQGDGKVGIGTNTPTQLLHLNSTSNSSILLNHNWMGSGSATSGLYFANNGSNTYEINVSNFPACNNGRLKIGPTGTTNKAIYFRGSQLFFSNNASFGSCGSGGLTGTYLFDAQVSSTSLLVAPAAGPPSPYPSIPSGYILSIQGNAHLRGRTNIISLSNELPDNAIAGLNISNTTTGTIPYSWIQTESAKPLALNPIPSSTSYVAIGFAPGDKTVPTGYKLAVDGNIICTELKVKASSAWPDYVFDKNYNLTPLDSVAIYVAANQHLPEVPSAEQVEKEGINSGEMDQILLKKIEELTLYMIEQKKMMDEQKKEIEELKAQNQELAKQVTEISK